MAVNKDGVYIAEGKDFQSIDGDWVYKGEPLEVDITDFVNNKNLTSIRYMFNGSFNYKSTAVKKVVLGKNSVTNMSVMFRDSQATSLDLSSFDTSSVTDMSYMFYGSQVTTLDLSSFDTSSVTSMRNMFRNSQATSLDLSSFDTSSVTDMYTMFRSSPATSLDLSSFDTSSVTDMRGMFYKSQATTGYARTQVDADKFNSSSDKPAGLVFVVKRVNKDGVYIAEEKDFQSIDGYWIYKGEPLEVDITDFVNSKDLTSTSRMFSGVTKYSATPVKRVVLGKNSVTDMGGMFDGSQATSLDLSSFDTSRVTSMGAMFAQSQATSLDLSSFDTSSVTNMYNMFMGSQATSLDLSSFNTSSVTSMGAMFAQSQATRLDLSSFDTSSVTSMGKMFAQSQATSLDLSSFDTSRVTNMNNMFMGSQATTGYARTQADAKKFNSSSDKPAGLVFVVKPPPFGRLNNLKIKSMPYKDSNGIIKQVKTLKYKDNLGNITKLK